MQAQAIPPVVMAGIAFYVASSQLLVFFRRKDDRESLTFALSCLAVGVYDLLCAGLYSASSVVEGASWQRAQFACLALVAIPLIWFVANHTRQGDRRLLRALSAVYALFAIAQLVDRSDLTFRPSEPSIKRVHLPAGIEVTYHEAAPGIVAQAQALLGLLVVVYMLRLAVLAYRGGRRRQSLALLAALGLFVVAVLNDSFVSMGLYSFVYLIEYGYMAIIVLMAWSLSGTVVEAATTKEALREKTAELERYFASALDLLCIADTSGTFRRLNPAWEAVLGYRVGELEGRRFLDFVHPDDQEPTRRALGRLGEQREVFDFVNRYRARDGSYRWIEWRSYPSGNAIYAAARDVTERRLAETALEESRRMLRLVLDTIPVRVFWKDTEGRYLGGNRPFATDAGFDSPEELLGRTDHDMPWKEQADLYRADDRQVCATGVPRIGYEEPQTTPSGPRLSLRTSKVPLHDTEGRIVGVLGTYEDVTESKRLDEERANLQAQLYQAQKMESVGRLAGGVAHDFNNLLHVIMGFVELLRRRMPADPRLATYVDEIERAASRAQEVTRQLLAFSRRQVIAPVPSDLNRLVTRLSGGLSRLIGEDVEIRVPVTDGLWPVKVDPTQVDQILLNLAVNARDAMPRGGTLTIETANVRLDESYRRQHATARPGDYVLLAISDTGTGMDKETLSHAFEPFFTTKERGKGTGLGLATVHGIVEQSGGFVNVYSEPGQGTTFKIYLPRALEAGVPEPAVEEPLDHVGVGTVLVAEDEESVRRITVALVQSLGYDVVAVSSGDEAIERCRADAPRIDVVLTDVVMPGTSGRELRQRLEQLRPGIRILFTSGYTANVIAHHGILDEGVHFIAKPFGIADLAKALRDLLAADPPARAVD